ncbi:MAG: clostripain-related cysteine peptidase [Mucilaginibacter sp.]
MENSLKGQGNKWLIIFLIYADFTAKEKQEGDIEKLKITINNMLGDIITTPIVPDQSRMYVVMNSIKFVFNDPKNGIDDKSAFYTIERTADRKQNHITKCEILDNSIYYAPTTDGGQVLQKACQLEAILKKTCVKADEEVFLITWDHGSSFGMFRAQPHSPDVLSVKKEVERNLLQFPFLKQFWDKARKQHLHGAKTGKIVEESLIEPCKESKKAGDIKTDNGVYVASGNSAEPSQSPQSVSVQPIPRVAEILTNRELNDALQGWLGCNRKVGVLLMVNCWMMNLHTMYALRDSVHCLVAPQGNIDCPGYNIKDILTEITSAKKNGIQPTELAKVCVTTIDNDYSKAKAAILSPIEPDVIERFKIFAVDLSSRQTGDGSYLENQIESLDTLFRLLIDDMNGPPIRESLKYFFKYIRSVSFDFSRNKTKTIDILNWIKSIQQADLSLNLTILSSPVRDGIAIFLDSVSRPNNIVLASSSGKKIYVIEDSEDYWATIGLPPTGYSLFFPMIYPALNLDLLNLIDNVSTDELLTRLKNWRNFLNTIDPLLSNFFPAYS